MSDKINLYRVLLVDGRGRFEREYAGTSINSVFDYANHYYKSATIIRIYEILIGSEPREEQLVYERSEWASEK